jgi:hypothetical protein
MPGSGVSTRLRGYISHPVLEMPTLTVDVGVDVPVYVAVDVAVNCCVHEAGSVNRITAEFGHGLNYPFSKARPPIRKLRQGPCRTIELTISPKPSAKR